MKWLKSFFKKIFSKSKSNYLPEPQHQQQLSDLNSQKQNFIVQLKSITDFERDDRNGYRIKPNLKLKDMV